MTEEKDLEVLAKPKRRKKAKKKTKKKKEMEVKEEGIPTLIEETVTAEDIAHAERAHAVLSPSSSKFWINCPGQPYEIKDIPRKESGPAAVFGTYCHEQSELRIMQILGEQEMAPYEDIADEEAKMIVQSYTSFVINVYTSFCQGATECKWYVEQRVRMADGCYGTADFVAVRKYQGKIEILIIDLKTGYNYVEVEDNSQVAIYALGAKKLHRATGDLHAFLYSPRIHTLEKPYKKWLMDEGTQDEWEYKIQDGISKSLAILNEEEEKILCAGTHCKWCPAEGSCSVLKKDLEDSTTLLLTENPYDTRNLEKGEITPSTLTIEEVGLILNRAEEIKSFLAEVEENAKRILQSGTEIHGFKLVETKTRRKWDSEQFSDEALGQQLQELGIEDPYTKKVLTLTQAETLLGTGRIDHLCTRTTPSLKVAKDKDTRKKVAKESLKAVDLDE